MLRERLTGELAAILRRAGTTALYVTHDHDEAFAVADRIAVLVAGRLLQVDTPAGLWRAPASRAVAEFLGYEGFLPVVADDGAPALLAIAPGALRVARDDARASGGTLIGVVVDSRPRRGGTEIDVRLTRPPGEAIGPLVTALDPGACAWTAGAEVLLVLEVGGAVVVPVSPAG